MQRLSRGSGGDAATFGTSASIAEQPEIDDAVVGGQEVQKPFVVIRVDAEQRQQRPIVAARIRETEVYQFAQVVSGDVTRKKEWMYVIPE